MASNDYVSVATDLSAPHIPCGLSYSLQRLACPIILIFTLLNSPCFSIFAALDTHIAHLSSYSSSPADFFGSSRMTGIHLSFLQFYSLNTFSSSSSSQVLYTGGQFWLITTFYHLPWFHFSPFPLDPRFQASIAQAGQLWKDIAEKEPIIKQRLSSHTPSSQGSCKLETSLILGINGWCPCFSLSSFHTKISPSQTQHPCSTCK